MTNFPVDENTGRGDPVMDRNSWLVLGGSIVLLVVGMFGGYAFASVRYDNVLRNLEVAHEFQESELNSYKAQAKMWEDGLMGCYKAFGGKPPPAK